MSQQIPTVTIIDPDRKGEPLVINQRDFDPKKHKPWTDKAQDDGKGGGQQQGGTQPT